MRYDVVFIITALACLLVGECLGMWMGITQDFLMVPAHAHLNLLGWVTLAIYGLAHRVYPALATAKLAFWQWLLATIGAIAMPLGIALLLSEIDTHVVKVAALIVIVSTVLFLIMFAGKAAAAKPA